MFEDALVVVERGDVEESDCADGDGEDVPNAVLRRRRDARGPSGWNREYCIVEDRFQGSSRRRVYRVVSRIFLASQSKTYLRNGEVCQTRLR